MGFEGKAEGSGGVSGGVGGFWEEKVEGSKV